MALFDEDDEAATNKFARKRGMAAAAKQSRKTADRMSNGTSFKPVSLRNNATLKNAVSAKGRNVRSAIKAAETRKAAGKAKIKNIPRSGRVQTKLGTTGIPTRVVGRKVVAASKGAGGGGKKHDGK